MCTICLYNYVTAGDKPFMLAQASGPGLPDFSRYNVCFKTGENIPNDYKIHQIATTCTKWPTNTPNDHMMHYHFSYQGPAKYPNWDFRY
jgi:hypothetical protein